MAKKYQVNIKDAKIAGDMRLKVQRMFNNANQNLSFVFVELYLNQPMSGKELSKVILNDVGIAIERTYMYQLLSKLEAFNLTSKRSFGSVLSSEESSEHDESITRKHGVFEKNIPTPFKRRFENMNYYYVTKYGEEFIPFVCKKILGIEVYESKK